MDHEHGKLVVNLKLRYWLELNLKLLMKNGYNVNIYLVLDLNYKTLTDVA